MLCVKLQANYNVGMNIVYKDRNQQTMFLQNDCILKFCARIQNFTYFIVNKIINKNQILDALNESAMYM